MNIFVVDKDPVTAAQQLCDRHVIKMVLETAQLLCSVFEPGSAPYKRTHFNHPCAIWTRQSEANFDWLVQHGIGLADEYTRRYGKIHGSRKVIEWAAENKSRLAFTENSLTPFAQAMPEKYKATNSVDSYRAYYLSEKSSFATWKSPALPPSWWKS
jgi:hypothetical protein